jgi:2-aminoethylphosphonate-pyruvate transaminase
LSIVSERGSEPLLFTPGPLTTSLAVKKAMLTDLGSRDPRFIDIIQNIRDGLLKMGGVSQQQGWECVLMQGSGTFMVESVLGSVVPQESGKLLVVANGAYGARMASMAAGYKINHEVLTFDEDTAPCPVAVADMVKSARESSDPFTHVAMVHHETTAGVLNPVDAVGKALLEADPNTSFIVDSMSGFGAYEVALEESNVSYIVSSANKNIEGVPGFSFALVKKDKMLAEAAGNARSVSLDLHGQWAGLEGNKQFRFTPPTHAMLAFNQALAEHTEEGGVAGRRARYERNFTVLCEGMAELGFVPLVNEQDQGCIITTFLFPDDANFDFQKFYQELSNRNMVIYPGKLTKADCFRIGSIGRLFEADMQNVVTAAKEILTDMGVALPVKQIVP